MLFCCKFSINFRSHDFAQHDPSSNSTCSPGNRNKSLVFLSHFKWDKFVLNKHQDWKDVNTNKYAVCQKFLRNLFFEILEDTKYTYDRQTQNLHQYKMDIRKYYLNHTFRSRIIQKKNQPITLSHKKVTVTFSNVRLKLICQYNS